MQNLSIFLGAETTAESLIHALLDFSHDKTLAKKIQNEIDANFESGETITQNDM